MKGLLFVISVVLMVCLVGPHDAAFSDAVTMKKILAERGEITFYRYYDPKAGKDYKGFSIAANTAAPSEDSDVVELTICVANVKVKLSKSVLKPDDGPCAGLPNGPFGFYTFFVPGRVQDVGNKDVTVAIKTAEGDKTTTLPRGVFGSVAPGEDVMFVPKPDLWGQSSNTVTLAFEKWETKDFPLLAKGGDFDVLRRDWVN